MYKIDFSSIPKLSGDFIHVRFIPSGKISMQAHEHIDFYEIFLILKGHIDHTAEGIKETLSSGDCRMLSPKSSHRFSAPTDHASMLNIAFPEPYFGKLLNQRYSKFRPSEIWRNGTVVALKFNHSEAELFREEAGRLLLETQFQELRLDFLLLLTLKTYLDRKPILHMTPPDWLQHAVTEAQRPERIPLDTPTFFQLCGRTPDHVGRVCRKFFDSTPCEFLRNLKLRRAAEKIVFSSEKIEVLASECGFDNPSYFYREFKRYYGITPRMYRIRHQTFL